MVVVLVKLARVTLGKWALKACPMWKGGPGKGTILVKNAFGIAQQMAEGKSLLLPFEIVNNETIGKNRRQALVHLNANLDGALTMYVEESATVTMAQSGI